MHERAVQLLGARGIAERNAFLLRNEFRFNAATGESALRLVLGEIRNLPLPHIRNPDGFCRRHGGQKSRR